MAVPLVVQGKTGPRKGSAVYIDGVVDHRVNDVYDFNKNDPEFSIFRAMTDKGTAKPFFIYGSNLEQLQGTLAIENGQITRHEFKWKPVHSKTIR